MLIPTLLGELICSSVRGQVCATMGRLTRRVDDNCYSDAATGYPDADYYPTVAPTDRFVTMRDALQRTGRAILYQICEWGVDFPSAWAPSVGNTWRVTNDIIPAWRTIYRILNQVVPQASYAGPHHWLDLDMLEVGNNVFNNPEEQTHFSLWVSIHG